MANPPFNVNGLPKPDDGNHLWIQMFASALNEAGQPLESHRETPRESRLRRPELLDNAARNHGSQHGVACDLGPSRMLGNRESLRVPYPPMPGSDDRSDDVDCSSRVSEHMNERGRA